MLFFASVSSVSTSGTITGVHVTNAGSGFTLKPPTVTLISNSCSCVGAIITCALTASSVGSIVKTNGGIKLINNIKLKNTINYSTTPTFVFTAISGGSGASATAPLNLGTQTVLTPSFYRTYTYTWNGIPPICINDLARLSAVNISATGFVSTAPYT